MKIAVLIKQVPVSNDVSVDQETHALVRSSSEGMINPADLNAIESAMLLKEQTEGSVTVFTMGPVEAEKALRDAMALGCDESCLLTDRSFAGGDTIATAKVLAEGIRKYGIFDLILCGALSSDGATGQVGAMTAEYLGIPHVAEVQGIKYENGAECIEALKKFQDKQFRISTKLPALMSVGLRHSEVSVRRNQSRWRSIPTQNFRWMQKISDLRDHRPSLRILLHRGIQEKLRC